MKYSKIFLRMEDGLRHPSLQPIQTAFFAMLPLKMKRHLFFNCPLARAIWFGVNWSLRGDAIQAANSQEILNWVIDPTSFGQDASMKSHCFLTQALTKPWES